MNIHLLKTLTLLVIINILFNVIIVETKFKKVWCPPKRSNETPQQQIFRKKCKESKVWNKLSKFWVRIRK